MSHAVEPNQDDYRFYVVDINKICIDSGWEYREDAMERAKALKEEGGVPKIGSRHRCAVGDVQLPVDDPASWVPKRNGARTNPGAIRRYRDAAGHVVEAGRAAVGAGRHVRDAYRSVRPAQQRTNPGDVRSPTSTSTEVRSPTSTSTEVRSPTSTSTDAYTAGNVTVTGGAGAGDTHVSITSPGPRSRSAREEHQEWRGGRNGVQRATDRSQRDDRVTQQDVHSLTRGRGRQEFADAPRGQHEPEWRGVENPARLTQEQESIRAGDIVRFYTVNDTLSTPRRVISVKLEDKTKYLPGSQPFIPTANVQGSKPGKPAEQHTLSNLVLCDVDGEPVDEEPEILGPGNWSSPRSNPGELLIVNGSEYLDDNPGTHKAEKVYAMWHQREPGHVGVVKLTNSPDDVMVCVGDAFSVCYRSKKWESGNKTNDYVHHHDRGVKVWMLESKTDPEDVVGTRRKTAGQLLAGAQGADGRFAVAELATPLSLCLENGSTDGDEINIHSGGKVYGAVDKKTVLIVDPLWGLIVLRGGAMSFDERGIVK